VPQTNGRFADVGAQCLDPTVIEALGAEEQGREAGPFALGGRRLEDPELVTGAARYVADLPGTPLAAHFVRSTAGHAVVRGIDRGAALEVAGVVAVLTAADLGLPPIPPFALVDAGFARPPLATDRVRFVGEQVAVVLATTAGAAADGADAVVLDLEPLPVVVDPDDALSADAPLLFPAAGTNQVFRHQVGEADDPLVGAAVVVELDQRIPRISASPIEAQAILVEPTDDGLVVHASNQAAHTLRDDIARALGMEAGAVRVVVPAVGGGFGAKFHLIPELVVVAAAARRLRRAVRWLETRSEHLVGPSHGRGQRQRLRMGFDVDGAIVGLDADLTGDAGGYPALGAVMANATLLMLPGPYRIPRVRAVGRGVVTCASPTVAYRGAGRPEATLALERLLDLGARALDVDPVDLRQRNLLTPAELPCTTPTGLTYDTGRYAVALARACAAVGYDAVRAEQARRRTDGATVALGVGVSVYLDVTPFSPAFEHAAVDVVLAPAGPRVTVRTGGAAIGQGHHTTWAVLVGRVLGIDPTAVALVEGDTAAVARGWGSASARSAQTAGPALHAAAGAIVDQARLLAAAVLEAAVDDVVCIDGRFAVRGVPDRAIGWTDLAVAPGAPGVLRAESDFTPPASSFPFGAHATVVEVDTETGRVAVVRHVAVDDCGTAIVPWIVAGQQHGGAVQGIGEALWEEIVVATDGTPRSTNLVDYGIPGPADVPALTAVRMETPTPHNVLGAKGIGQSGAIGAPAAVLGAVVDALSHLGVTHLDAPATPARVWAALSAARR
jgi:aerobic carbon-monoxide dehydrogenase large subunit